jgi:DNA-binding transcriptional LysR family regulator
VRAGIGIALLSSYHVYDDPNVVELTSPTLLPNDNLWLALHKDLQHNARIRACADFLTAEIAKLENRLRGVRAKSVRR